jgi:hypothetical protein
MLCADEVIGNQGTPGDGTFRRMRELAIIITAFVALSAVGRKPPDEAMTILELPSLHQSGVAQSGRVSSGPKNTIAKRALPGSNGSCWLEADQAIALVNVCC